jgi:hypothetical protein
MTAPGPFERLGTFLDTHTGQPAHPSGTAGMARGGA